MCITVIPLRDRSLIRRSGGGEANRQYGGQKKGGCITSFKLAKGDGYAFFFKGGGRDF